MAPSFPGLHQFPEGCGFKQWTGDDSKVLMKVCQYFASYLLTIPGLPFCHCRPCSCTNGACNKLLYVVCYLVRCNIIKKEIEGNLIIVYMDDVLGFSKTIDRLKTIEQIVLEKAREHDLFFKAKKCKFRKQKIKHLGLVVQKGKLAMDLAKLKGILDWPTPKTVKEV